MADVTLAPENTNDDISRPTSADLSAKQYHVVKHNTSESVVISGANEKSLGILQNKPDGSSVADVAVVRTGGLSKAIISETVAFGKFLTPDADGKLEVCNAANEEYIAVALTSGEAGDLILVRIQHGEVTATDA